MSAPFILFDDCRGGVQELFEAPLKLITAWEAEEVPAAFAAMEEARAAGLILAGFTSYELGYALEPALLPLMPSARRVPLICFGVFEEAATGVRVQSLMDRIFAERQHTRFTAVKARLSVEAYREAFEQVLFHIREGDTYQVNLTMPLDVAVQGSSLGTYGLLRSRQRVHYGALCQLGEVSLASLSPELFFEVKQDGSIETLPMKGTMPRGKTREEDEHYRDFLKSDPKNRAENLMIVDLLRNDLSRISEIGSVRVPQLFHVESYQTLHQMVSRITARLLPGICLQEIWQALFPCGSITGAPKIRSMEIIRNLEESPRDVYCGAIGLIRSDGTMRFNVAIRTLSLYDQGHAVYNVGGGVVYDSQAETEYEECLLKAGIVSSKERISS